MIGNARFGNIPYFDVSKPDTFGSSGASIALLKPKSIHHKNSEIWPAVNVGISKQPTELG